jgi:HAD superfamily hydrolase (TIGR01509 family)
LRKDTRNSSTAPPPIVKAIIFDCDGVLVDSESLSNGVLLDMASEVGVDLDEAFAVTHFAGKALSVIFQEIAARSDQQLPLDFEQKFRQRTFEAFKQHLKPIEGIHALLDILKLPYCVASSGPVNKIELNLKLTGLYDYFKGNIYSSYQINSWKPNPDIFLHAATQMGFLPNQCLVVEDSLAGVHAAKSGGFPVVGLINKYNQEELEQEQVPTIHRLSSIGRWVG